MRLKTLAILLAIYFIATAHAQVASLYVTSSNTRLTNVRTGFTYPEQFTNFWASGVGGGVTLNFLPLPIISVGLDLRGSTRPGTVGADSGFVGFRLQVKPPVIRIKPYVQASGGWVGTRAFNSGGSGTFNNNYAAYEILGGVDYPLIRFIDFRVIEVGGGQGYDIGAGRVSTAPNLSLFNINSGLVLHF